MPLRARRICKSNGCHAATDRADGYCQQCCDDGKNIAIDYRRRKQTEPFYVSPEWRKYRSWWLMLHPLCVFCGRPGQMVDHKKPIKDGGAKLDPNNTQTFCYKCHARKTGSERSARGSSRP